MSESDSDSELLSQATRLLQQADEKYQRIVSEEKELEPTCQKLLHHFLTELEKARPLLPCPATRQECLQAKNDFTERYQSLQKELKEPREQLFDHFNRRLSLVKEHEPLKSPYSCYYRLRKHFFEERRALFSRNTHLKNKYGAKDKKSREKRERLVDGACGLRDNLSYQLALHKMMEGQSDELKELVLFETGDFASHLKKQSGKPTVTLGKSVGIDSQSLSLPMEIASMIFAKCSLESCVALQEVNRSFYAAFNLCDYTMHDHMTRCYPWMGPEEAEEAGIRSWADCVLVLAKRLSCGNWETDSRFYSPLAKEKPEPTLVQDLIAVELTEGHNMPDNFRLIETSPKPVERIKHEVITSESNDKQLVVMAGGVKITLPGHVTLRDDYPVTINKRFVAISTTTDTYHVRRREPDINSVHVESGCCSTSENDRHQIFELGYAHGYIIFEERDRGRYYRFYNDKLRRLHSYGSSGSNDPIAYYNGIYWWLVEGKYLLPTFFCLGYGNFWIEEHHFRKDHKMMVLGEKKEAGDFHQCDGKHGNNRFVTFTSSKGLSVVDLATSTITEVQTIEGEKDASKVEFYLGYTGAVFGARYRRVDG